MRRLVEKRWLALVLTLSILFASGLSLPSRSRADNGMDPITLGDNPGGTQGPAGDPDGPAGPNKRAPGGGRTVRNGMGYTVTPVGDGGSVLSVWKWRVQLVLQVLKIRVSRF